MFGWAKGQGKGIWKVKEPSRFPGRENIVPNAGRKGAVGSRDSLDKG